MDIMLKITNVFRVIDYVTLAKIVRQFVHHV